LVANYYKAGPATMDEVKNRIIEIREDESRWYIADNYVDGYPGITRDDWSGGVQGPASLEVVKMDSPLAAPPISVLPAPEAYELVLANVGARLPKCDTHDTRIIEEVRTGTATYGGKWRAANGIIDSQAQVGGWPELKSSPPPLDTDHDGMPDAWETAHSLVPNDPNDGPADRDGDGYTNVEEYLNGLVPDSLYGF
jgi:hypothetical protein